MIFNESEFNSHWELRTLNDLGAFGRGKSKHRPRNDVKLFEGGTYPLVQTGEIREARLYVRKHGATYNEFGLDQSKLWSRGTLCITIAANIAETAILGYPMCFPDSVVGFKADPEISSEVYVHYVFTYIRKTIQNATSGSIQDNINIDFLTALNFRIPDKPEQDAIANVLSSLDSKIELNDQIGDEMDRMARLLYDYWFVQFDFPISGALAAEMDAPHLQGKPYRSSGGKMTYNEALQFEIPECFQISPLSDIATITMGQSPPGDSYNAAGDGELFFQGSTDFGWRFPSPRQYTTCATRIAEAGDILLSVRAPVGTLNVAPSRCAIGRGLAALRSNNGQFAYLFGVLEYFRQTFERRNKDGTTFGAINKDDLHSLQFAQPPKELVELYERTIAPNDNIILANHLQNIELIKLRDWLLPMLMNGQVAVRLE